MNWVLAHFAAVTITFFALAAVAVILQQRRTPQSTAAWLLFIILLPYVATPLFLALGFRKRGKRFTPIRFGQASTLTPETPATGIESIFAHHGIPAASKGNQLELLTSGAQAHNALRSLCRSAEHSLDVLFYLIADDPVGRGFLHELTERARAGVRVRVIMDRLANLKPPRAALGALRDAGGRVVYFSPLLQRPDSGHLNLRNHRKMVIADSTAVFAGGMNIGHEYMGPYPDPTRWSDLAYLLTGPATASFNDVFRSDWTTAKGGDDLTTPPVPPAPSLAAGSARVQLVPSGPDTAGDPLHDALVSAIHRAKQRVWIVTPYFLPTDALNTALMIAAKRGVDLRIMLPEKSNQLLADFARGAYLREMQNSGCRILFYQPGMIHAKAGLIDGFAYVGSANFDIRSMLLNFESALFIHDDATLTALAGWYQDRAKDCVVGVPPAGPLRRMSQGIFRLGAPVL
ncbi:MAG: phospholipase D-like domain-containing protein [Paracoccaceae bacterium]